MILFIGLVIFNIGMYSFIYQANQDPLFNSVGSASGDSASFDGTSTDTDVSYGSASSWLDGFKINVFGLPSWFNFIYVTLLASLNGICIYGLIRGL